MIEASHVPKVVDVLRLIAAIVELQLFRSLLRLKSIFDSVFQHLLDAPSSGRGKRIDNDLKLDVRRVEIILIHVAGSVPEALASDRSCDAASKVK
jgi:hypothetical protein